MKFKLDLIYSDLYQLKNRLRSIIHSILFCRLLIPTKPEVVDCSIFNLTDVKIRNDKIDKKVIQIIFYYYTFKNGFKRFLKLRPK